MTLAERFGGRHVTPADFEAMVGDVAAHAAGRSRPSTSSASGSPAAASHLLGTSGTVTTVAGIQLGLTRYDRNRVDGCWLNVGDVRGVTADLLGRTYEQRVAEPCIGRDRADLVLAGCAILEAMLRMWPCERLRVADRGLREGILTTLMVEDGVLTPVRRRRRRRLREAREMTQKRGGGPQKGPGGGQRRDARSPEDGAQARPSSQRWLERQLNDPYVSAAKRDGMRSRAAYKLSEIDDKYQLLKPGARRRRPRRRARRLEPDRRRARAVDRRQGPGGRHRLSCRSRPLPGVEFVQLDFTDEGAEES